MSKTQSTYDKIELILFKTKEEVSGILTQKEIETKERWMFCVSKKMDDPMVSDSDLINFLTGGCEGLCIPVSKATAYRDVASISRLAGNIQLAAKNWYRYMIVEGAKKAYAIAENKEDAKGMAAALDKLGKYTRADKEDNEFDWSQMIPPSFEPSDDVTLLGDDFEPIENLEERRRELRGLFKREVVDAEYTDVKNADTE